MYQQGKDEGLTDFLHRLKDQIRKYSGLNLDDSQGQAMLKLHSVTNSWPDMAKKLQKIENRKDKSLEELLREAQNVYVSQDEEKQKQKAKIMLSTIGQITQEKNTFQRAGPRPTQKPQKGRPNSLASGGKRTGATGVGSQDISNENVLREGRKK
jgi:esterase/lipase